ncbi:hypothetical protein [Streptomyces sp. NPDC051001]|uniref:hypothetical protein n=1 Tax=Streptomyces sp. NPDC051001 TaxID=3155795 RepID=UPI003436A5BA
MIRLRPLAGREPPASYCRRYEAGTIAGRLSDVVYRALPRDAQPGTEQADLTQAA